MGIMYATREQVTQSLEVLEKAYAGFLIDAKIDAASRAAEGFLHRRFYPELRTVLFDWPNRSGSPSWQLDLGDQELISAAAVTSGGTTITDDLVLRRGDNLAEPPYSMLQIDLTTDAAFSAGSTWQQSLSVRGTFGYNDTDTSLAGGTLSGNIDTDDSPITINPASGNFTVGIGALLKIGTERMIVVDRRMASTGFTTTSTMDDIQSGTSFTSASASSLAVGEVILIDAERMRIRDIAGTTVIVERAYDGTVLADHASGATIYALRSCLVRRGVLGSTAASHTSGASVYVHQYPPLLNELVIAESVVMLEQNASAYARTIGTGAGTREAAGKGLDDIRERAWRELGRKMRSAAI
jgi:hypothetical protein